MPHHTVIPHQIPSPASDSSALPSRISANTRLGTVPPFIDDDVIVCNCCNHALSRCTQSLAGPTRGASVRNALPLSPSSARPPSALARSLSGADWRPAAEPPQRAGRQARTHAHTDAERRHAAAHAGTAAHLHTHRRTHTRTHTPVQPRAPPATQTINRQIMWQHNR